MSTERLFTEEELKLLGTPSAELIVAAIDAGDSERAKELSWQLHTEATGFHDAFVHWVTSLLSHIGRHYGDEALEEAYKECVSVVFGPISEQYKQCDNTGDLRTKALMFIYGLRTHHEHMTITEDDEKFTLQMNICGSGGRMVLDGYYDPPCNFLKIEKPQPMTYGIKDFPVYCVHEPILEMLTAEWGIPIFFVQPANELGKEPCTFYLYKDAKDVPDEFYTRIGKEKNVVE